MIKFENFSYGYGTEETKTCLHNINLSIERGRCVVFCGRSGCGKTTLLHCLNGLIPELYPGRRVGSVRVLDLEMGKDEIYAYSQRVGSVFQNPKAQFFTNTVKTELVFGCENQGISREIMEIRLRETVELFQIKYLLEKKMFDLSGGEKQLVAFASAYMMQPDIYVLDEPSSHLDHKHLLHLEKLIIKLKEQGKTIVLAEHRFHYLKESADYFVYVEKGKIETIFPVQSFAKLTGEELEKRGLRQLSIEKSQRKEEELLDEEKEPQPDRLVLETVTFSYPKQKNPVFQNKKLELTNACIYAVMGENGSGKSTLFQLIAGLRKPNAGCIKWNGRKLAAKELIQQSFLVMQDTQYQLFCETVQKELTLRSTEIDLFDEIVDSLSLKQLLTRHPQSLSGGEKQRVAIASAILSGKKVLLLDEPTSGLDLVNMRRVVEILLRLNKKGLFVIVISHDEEFLSKIAHQKIFLP